MSLVDFLYFCTFYIFVSSLLFSCMNSRREYFVCFHKFYIFTISNILDSMNVRMCGINLFKQGQLIQHILILRNKEKKTKTLSLFSHPLGCFFFFTLLAHTWTCSGSLLGNKPEEPQLAEIRDILDWTTVTQNDCLKFKHDNISFQFPSLWKKLKFENVAEKVKADVPVTL